MLVRFEPRDKGQYSTLVEGDSQKFWDMIEERCGRDVADYLTDKINELEETIEECPTQDELDNMRDYLRDHLAVEEYLYNILDYEIGFKYSYASVNLDSKISELLYSWLRYMYINCKPYGLDRHDDKTAEAAIKQMDSYRKDYDKRWNA